MNKNIYIGTRIEHREMNELVGTSISRLNEGLSKNLRSSVLKKGIKKTEQGQKLHFYLVDEVQYQKLTSETDLVLVKVDGDELGRKLQEVNSRYPRRMDYGTSIKYKSELEREFENSVEVVGKDKNIRVKPVKFTGKNPYKVGDWISPFGWNLNDSPVRITRVSDSSIWYQYPYIKDENGNPIQHLSNYEYVKDRFCNVNGWSDSQEWDWTVPYKGNEDCFTFGSVVGPRRISEGDIKYPRTVTDVMKQGYRSERHESS